MKPIMFLLKMKQRELPYEIKFSDLEDVGNAAQDW